MKLTDLCILFAAIFICLILPLELRISDDRAKYYSSRQFNRSFDRIVADAMEDVVIAEDEEGRVIVDEEKVHERFDHLVELTFDTGLPDPKLYEAVKLNMFADMSGSPSYAQSEEIRNLLQEALNQRITQDIISGYRRQAAFFEMTFPYSPHESWYQSLYGPMFFVVFDPDDDNMPWNDIDRIVFSGSRIEKTRKN